MPGEGMFVATEDADPDAVGEIDLCGAVRVDDTTARAALDGGEGDARGGGERPQRGYEEAEGYVRGETREGGEGGGKVIVEEPNPLLLLPFGEIVWFQHRGSG